MENSHLSRLNAFTILLIPFVWLYEASVIGPTLGQLAQAFPAASELQIKLVMTAPFLTSIIFSVISGKLANTFDKKTITVTGLFIYGVTGIMPAFAVDINQILMYRLLTGIGVGLVLPLPNAIIAEHYTGEKRERMLGMATAVANIANIVASIIIGFVLVLGWQYPYYSFGLVLVIMLVAVFGLPKSPPRPVAETTQKSAGVPPVVWGLALFMTVNFLLLGFNIFNCALFMTAEKIGPPWMIGIAISVPAMGCTLAGAFFPELCKSFKSFFVTGNLILFAIGFGVLYQAHSFPAILVANFLCGFGSGALVPYVLYQTADKVPDTRKDMAYGIVTSCIHFGYLISPFAQNVVSQVGNNPSHRFLFLSAMLFVAVAAVVSFCFKKQLAVRTVCSLNNA